jgi:chemotaxis signal transduction protein
VNARSTDFDRSVRDEGLVCCAVGDDTYALRGADVHQLVRVEQMLSAGDTDVRAGTLELAGESVPVFRLGAVLGRSSASGAANAGHHIAVTGEPGALVGWLVDRIVRTPLYDGAQVVALPVVVGGDATAWFEAIVRLDDDSVLLLAPQYLNPLAEPPARPAPPDGARSFSASPSAAAGAAEPMILLFSTPALPHCEAPRYALSGRRIAAIAQPLSPIVVPGSAPHVTGVAWWRNAVVPLIDFRAPGRHVDEAQLRRCVIARCGTRLDSALVAFPVNSDIAVHRPSADDRQSAAAPHPDFTLGMFDVDGEAVALLDLDALLAPTLPATLQVDKSLEEPS